MIESDDIKRMIETGEISAVSLDTSIFHRNGYGLERGLLERLEQFKGSGVVVVLSDLVCEEVKRHMLKDAVLAMEETVKAIKKVSHTWLVPEDVCRGIKEQLFQESEPQNLVSRRFGEFIERVGAVIAKAEDYVRPAELMRRYFNDMPPFLKDSGKKHEFPDALALITLEAWAEENNATILTVSADGDWTSFCERSHRLIAINDLSETLSCFQREKAVYDCQLISHRILAFQRKEMETAIRNALNEQNWKVGVNPEADSPYQYDADVFDVSFGEIAILNLEQGASALTPIEYKDGVLVARISVETLAGFACHFSFFTWDGIDREYISAGSTNRRETEYVNVDLLITLAGDLPEIFEVENIEILENTLNVYYGEVTPDWMNDPDDFDE